MSPARFNFKPIAVNGRAPRGPCVIRTFDDVGVFILGNVEVRQQSPQWMAIRQKLIQARFGARRAEMHQAVRDALAVEGWLE